MLDAVGSWQLLQDVLEELMGGCPPSPMGGVRSNGFCVCVGVMVGAYASARLVVSFSVAGLHVCEFIKS